MIYIFQELSILGLSTIFMLFFLLINLHHKNIFFNIDNSLSKIKTQILLKQPVKFLYNLVYKTSILFRLLCFILIISFCLCLFFFLTKKLSLFLSIILTLPLSLSIIYIFYYLISIFSIILIKIIDVGSFSLNLYFL